MKKYNSKTGNYSPYGKQSQNAKSITVHPNGSLYMVSASNDVYIDVSGRWNLIPGIKTNEVDIDKNGNVRALNLSGRLYNLYQGKWQPKSLVNKNNSGFNQLIGKDSKTLYARFKNNSFKQFKSGKWVALNGSPIKITMDDKTGDVYAVGRNKGIYKWENGKWILLKNTRKDLKDVAVHNGKIWATATNKTIYYYDYKSSVNNSPKDYAGTYRVEFTRFINVNPDEYFGAMGVYLEAKTSSGNITIKPKDNKPNRVWDYTKSNPVKLRNEKVTIDGEQFINRDFRKGADTWSHSLRIDKVREFVVLGEAANKYIVFDFQFNVKKKNLIGESGKWERVKIKVSDLKQGFEYFYWSNEAGYRIGFKIEKL